MVQPAARWAAAILICSWWAATDGVDGRDGGGGAAEGAGDAQRQTKVTC